jgi:hypothetical protein
MPWTDAWLVVIHVYPLLRFVVAMYGYVDKKLVVW